MSLLRCLSILSLLSPAVVSAAWASTSPINLVVGEFFTSHGLKLEVGSCSVAVNSTTSHSCDSNDHLSLREVNTGRGTISYELFRTTSSYALVNNNVAAPSSLEFTVLVSLDGTSPNIKVTGASLTAVGKNNVNNCATGCTASASAAFSNGATAATLAAALAPINDSALHTVTVGPGSVTSPIGGSNTFTITETVNLSSGGATSVDHLKLATLALKLTTAPEPASIGVLLLGLGGLVLARRRRAS